MAAAWLSGAPLGAHRLVERRTPEAPFARYMVFRPDTAGARAPVFVTVHGISRNAREHAELFMPYAERLGAWLVAPVFAEAEFGKYQQLVARDPATPRSDEALLRILDDLARTEPDADPGRILLFGFSGGGQFAHRFAMAHPDRVRATAIGAAGWYTLPDPSLRYPYGIGPSPHRPGLCFEPDRFLRNRFQVLVGPKDVSRNGAIRKSERIDALQGETRLERGRRWIEAMRAAAHQAAIPAPRLGFATLSGGRHSFARAMTRYGLGEAVVEAFGDGGTGAGWRPSGAAGAAGAWDAARGWP